MALEPLGEDRFRALHNLDNGMGAVFGGQALGQAVAAALRTVADWVPHTLTGYFIRSGNVGEAIEYQVERVSDSRRFATRRIRALQGERLIFEASCSFHDAESGIAHQYADFGQPPEPESLVDLKAFSELNAHRLSRGQVAMFSKSHAIELRLTDPDGFFKEADRAVRDYWFRIPSASAVDDPRVQRALLAFMSDYWFPGAIAATHMGEGAPRSLVSLNQSMWFHSSVRTEEWLLFRTESHWADEGRGLVNGRIFNREGRLLASLSQEALLRY